jgi:hypothetical protein
MMLAAFVEIVCRNAAGQFFPWRRLTAQGLAEESVNDVVGGVQ